ncbi:DNA-binding NtrC family response regulator [Variovorax paradoxus]|uniref:sigma-54-dependent Fis family transcriptional regulator n=1 Tax=Variovorax paradoxus TaxID=34073 RepID=UPI002785B6C2|nr:sigma-54-dependent Fis family transcriptional regulator [Variovorax paradoxus]MDP9928345.1 DNA-binding NtrC family response regulator [Variovorax paradoxus]MDQ0024983.1 DNA-binding NtrC family response regulator [Variovorax paradoxus]
MNPKLTKAIASPVPGRISLAEVARATGAALGRFDGADVARAMSRFDASHVGSEEHPTIADISECLFFSPGDGRIWLQDQRMVLLHTEALGSLRRELIDSLGQEKARGLFTRAGYVSGARDAQLVRKHWPEAEPAAAAMAGTRLHALEGLVKVELVHARYDPETSDYEGEFIWHHSVEDDEHIAAYGIGGSPACWMQVGYATGYVSTLFGRLVVFREVACRSMGENHCRVIGKSAERWDDVEEDMRYLRARDFVGVAVGASPHGGAAPRAAELPTPPRKSDAMVGASSAFNAACHLLHRVAPTTATVLFTGESGVGKEKFASMLHSISPRRDKPFVAVNCAAIPETLIESELFGVERGAYTGAGAARPGRFERAHGGTLFLDEIGTLSYAAQGKLLRTLQEGEVERVGSTRSVQVDTRVIAATNVDLRQAVREGRFRDDLFFRLNVFPIHLPPLRERRDDVPLLMSHFLQHYGRKHGRQATGFTQSAVKALLNYDYPGNIRELQNLIERAVIVAPDGSLLDVHHLFTSGETLDKNVLSVRPDGHLAGVGAAGALPRQAMPASHVAPDRVGPGSLGQVEETLIRRALEQCGGNLSAAARVLGITRPQLAYRVRKRGLMARSELD